ncbi:MAG: methyltransferase domain-containing protein [bacterium]
MDANRLRSEIIELGPWHHDVQIAPGIRTGEPVPPGTYPSELGTPTIFEPELNIRRLFGDIFPTGLEGRSVLDCACNAGGNLFASKRLGAARCFGFDVREHWIRQARFLARHVPSDDMQFEVRDLATLPDLGLERFDVTLFMGIFYHLPDPMTGLRIAADLTSELLVINTAMRRVRGVDALMVNPESQTLPMSGVHGLAWLPTGDRVLQDILRWCGFPHTRVDWQMPRRGKSWARLQLLAAREAHTFAHYDAVHPPGRAARAKSVIRNVARMLRRS